MNDSPNLSHSSDNDYDRIFNETFFSEQRKFSVFGNESSLKEFRSNKVQTSKYNFLTFLPLNLFYQFTKIANVYFAFQACLQMVPQISITYNNPTILSGLIPVVLISMFKDLFEDLKRKSEDNVENN
jgi:hypothetical protein